MISEETQLINDTGNVNNHKIFDKYIIYNTRELEKIKDVLEGAIMFTSDNRHVGIHKLFYLVHWLKKRSTKIDIDANICHAMIIIKWDSNNHRPILAHSVSDGVKINAVDYLKPIKYCGVPFVMADKLIVICSTGSRATQRNYD